MLSLTLIIIIRIFSNSYLNVFQKILTNKNESPSVINFFTYLGLSIIAFLVAHSPVFDLIILKNVILMGLCGALGNYFIIKALACGELSVLAPINSYKPVVALLVGMIILQENPTLMGILGIGLIIIGTIILANKVSVFNKSIMYRIFALIFSATEAIFIKQVLLLSSVSVAFLYWAFAGMIFSLLFAATSSHPLKIGKNNVKFQFLLIISAALMQYSTNYVFSKMNVAYALALFQLSTVISVFLGVNLFKEKDLLLKLSASLIMLIGAVVIILGG